MRERIPSNVKAFALASFLRDVASEMVYPLLPGFFASVLKTGATFLGITEGIVEATASLLKGLSGYWSDRVRKRKPLVLLGYGISAIATPLIGFAHHWWIVLAARFGDRVGKGIRTAPRDALIADSVEENIRGKSFGLHRAADTAGAVVGPLIAWALMWLSGSNYRLVFWLSLIPGALCLLILAVFVKEIGVSRLRKGIKASLRELPIPFFTFLGIMGFFSLGNSSNTFLLLKAQAAGLAPALVPALYALFNIVYAVTAYPLGALSDKWGRKRLLVLGFLIYGAVYLLAATVGAAWAWWFILPLYGVFYGASDGIERAMVADIVRDERLRGTAYGLYHMTIGMLLLPASLLAGFLWDKVSPQAPFFIGGAVGVSSAIMLIFWRK
ncbi:MAG: MFS transporter [candidate division WOR-3 bacterium]